MKTLPRWALLLALALVPLPGLFAADKDGLRVLVQESVVERSDSRSVYNTREINRKMTLKAQVTNISFSDLPSGKVEYVILIRRWGMSEAQAYVRYKGTSDVPELPRSKQVTIPIGEFRIGGHLHGTSKIHVDDVAAWKLTFKLGDKIVDFINKSDFNKWNEQATDATD